VALHVAQDDSATEAVPVSRAEHKVARHSVCLQAAPIAIPRRCYFPIARSRLLIEPRPLVSQRQFCSFHTTSLTFLR